jgi:hypothetical protein
MKLSALFIAALPLASAWRLQLYQNEQYNGIIEDRSGSVGQPCKTLPANARNKASSMKWNGDGVGPIECEIVLYNYQGCREAGGILGRSEGNWNVPRFSTQANDKVESYKINC